MAEQRTLSERGRIILAGLVGNTIEWYDVAICGYFATVIGTQFFPSSDPALSLIAALGAFGGAVTLFSAIFLIHETRFRPLT